MTLIVGAKSVEPPRSRSSCSIAFPSVSGCEKSDRMANPFGPMSMMVPTGESTST